MTSSIATATTSHISHRLAHQESNDIPTTRTDDVTAPARRHQHMHALHHDSANHSRTRTSYSCTPRLPPTTTSTHKTNKQTHTHTGMLTETPMQRVFPNIDNKKALPLIWMLVPLSWNSIFAGGYDSGGIHSIYATLPCMKCLMTFCASPALMPLPLGKFPISEGR